MCLKQRHRNRFAHLRSLLNTSLYMWPVILRSDSSTCFRAKLVTRVVHDVFVILIAAGTGTMLTAGHSHWGECEKSPAGLACLWRESWPPTVFSFLLFSSSLLQDVDNSSPSMCDGSVRQKDMKVNYGQSVHLSCPLRVTESEEIERQGGLKWFFYRNEHPIRVDIASHNGKFVPTSDNGLVILGTTDREAGQYECRLGSNPLIRYDIFVDTSKFPPSISSSLLLLTLLLHFPVTETCTATSEPEFRKVYSEWCHEFETYKTTIRQLKQSVSWCLAF